MEDDAKIPLAELLKSERIAPPIYVEFHHKELTDEQLKQISNELQKLLYAELLKDNIVIPFNDAGIELVKQSLFAAYKKVMKHKQEFEINVYVERK